MFQDTRHTKYCACMLTVMEFLANKVINYTVSHLATPRNYHLQSPLTFLPVNYK